MKIIFGIHHFPPRFTGGAEWEVFRIALNLIKRDHQVQVICVENVINSKREKITWEDDNYQGIPVRRLFLEIRNTSGEFDRSEFDNRLIGQFFREYLLEIMPDIFHQVSGYLLTGRCLQVAKELNIPTVLSLEDFWFLCRRITLLRSNGNLSNLPINPVNCVQCVGEEKKVYQILGKVFPSLMKQYWKSRKPAIQLFTERSAFSLRILNQADAIISRSEFMRNYYIEFGVNRDRIILARQGQDIDSVSFGKKYIDHEAGKIRIGYLGQIAPIKGIDVIIKAFGLVKNPGLSLKIFGNDQAFPKYSKQLRQMAKEDPRIAFIGLVKREDINTTMQRLDAIVVPSLWYENSPNVILEAFMNRVPVIASNLGGMAELVKQNENGLLFEPGNYQELAGHLDSLLIDPNLLNLLRSGIKPVKSIQTEIDELISLYSSLLPADNR